MNPYEVTGSPCSATTRGRLRRLAWNVWGFAAVWPLVVIMLFWVPLPVNGVQLRFEIVDVFAAFAGCAVCIIAAVRYRASVRIRLLRGVGSISLMVAAGKIWSLLLGLASFAMWQS